MSTEAGRAALPAGSRVGPYEILALLGAGGMGEVYRARDARLERDVAVKVLPAAMAQDPERLARLGREARVLASLNHPHIGHVYGFEETELATPSGSRTVRALVMELVEGPTLAERIARGPIPIDEALALARQIVEALAAAHDQHIVHRDLKPGNIKLRPDGTVKVLDFGLAKALDPALDGAAEIATISAMSVSVPGQITGTPAYLAPEQARGAPVDRRADLWAFGCVLFEMLTGRRPFAGDTLSDVLAKILEREPDWPALPATTPAAVHRLLRRCLEKDVRRRLDSAAVARMELEEASAPPTRGEVALSRPGHGKRWPLPALAAGIAVTLGAVAVAAWIATRPVQVPTTPVIRFPIALPPAETLAVSFNDRDLALSADGTRLAYTTGSDANLMVRRFDQLEAVPIADVSGGRAPFFSPDGEWIGFFDRVDEPLNMASIAQRGTLRKVPAGGGPTTVVASLIGASRGASWGPGDSIVFATTDSSTGLLRVSGTGGEPEVLTRPDTERGERDHYFPSILPDGHSVLFTIQGSTARDRQIAILDLKTGQHRTVLRSGSQPEYVETGHLVYADGGAIWAVRFDAATSTVVGTPILIVEQVMTLGATAVTVSRRGALVYAPVGGRGSRSLVWVTRQGKEEPIHAPARGYRTPRLSPDGTRIAVQISDRAHDIYIWDFETLSRLTFHPSGNHTPTWMHHGRDVVYGSPRDIPGGSNLFRRAADGTGHEEQLTAGAQLKRAIAVSPAGSHLMFEQDMPPAGYDLMTLALDGSGRVQPLLATPLDERNAVFSPDGRWIAYESGDSGQSQVYVRPFPNVHDSVFQVSTEGGRSPLWAPHGHELYFTNGFSMMAVAVQVSPTFKAGSPTKLFDAPAVVLDGRFIGGTLRTFDISPDGQRFLMMKHAGIDNGGPLDSLIVVQNWREELKARVP